jgi:hypothetical protein
MLFEIRGRISIDSEGQSFEGMRKRSELRLT